MKKLLYTLSLVMLGTLAQAQVKIGSNPGTIGSSSNLEVESSSGNKTIIDKTTGKLSIVDGTQGAGRVFTSDANGNGSWVAGATVNQIYGTVPSTWPTIPYGTLATQSIKTNASITLTPGRWLIFFNATYYNNFNLPINIFWDLSTSSTSNAVLSRVVGPAAPVGFYVPVTATYDVSPTATTTYYVWALAVTSAGTPSGQANYTGEGRIYAIPVSN